jgi:ribosomal protein S18 acetylase RimI-like enzyme
MAPITFAIRQAIPEDTAAIVEIWKEFMDFHAVRDRHFTRSVQGHERFADFISGRIVHDASCVVVAEQAQKVVGYCLAVLSHYPPVFLYDTYGMISDLAVSASHRRQGIGQALVEHALAWFAERKISRIELRVAITNEISMAFWRKMGFNPYVEILYKNC